MWVADASGRASREQPDARIRVLGGFGKGRTRGVAPVFSEEDAADQRRVAGGELLATSGRRMHRQEQCGKP